jgi:hypothetical protein
MQERITELTRQRVSEALFLIGFGVIWAFNLWWPGILVAFGIPWSASLAIQRKYWASTVVAALLCVVPVAYLAFEAWDWIVPSLVVGVGAAGLARAVYLRR